MTHIPGAPGASFRGYSFRREMLKVFAIALTYFAAHQIAFFFPDSHKTIMLVWPAGGVALAALLLNPRRLWPVLTLAFFISGIAADMLLGGRSLVTAVGYMTANMVESLGCAWLIIYWAGDFRRFTRVKEILALIVGAVLLNGFSTCIGAGTSVLTCGASFWDAWQSWYIADGLGVLLIGPLIVAWIDVRGFIARLDSRHLIEGVACVTVWSLSTWFIFRAEYFAFCLHPYLLVALLAWPAMRFGQRGVTLAIVVLFAAAIAIQPLANGPSPWDGRELTSAERLLELQVFLGFMAVVGYLLAAGYTGLVQAEKAQQLMRFSIEHASDALFWITPDGRIVEVNAAACRSLGYRREELLRLTIPDVDPHYDLAKWPQHFAGLRQLGSLTFESEHRTKDGGRIPVEVVANYVQFGAEERNCAFVRDVTERRKAEEELRWKTAFLEAQVNSSLDGILVVDPRQKKLLSNQRLAELWGTPQHILDDPDDAAQLQYVVGLTKHPEEFYEKVVYLYEHPGETSRDEVEFKNGMVLDRYSAAVLGKDGKNYGRIWTFRDITDRKRAEHELRRTVASLESANAALEESNRAAQSATRAKSQFLANMSHEIRTPMTAILGYADFLLAEAGIEKAPPHRREAFETIRRNGKHLLGLINDILDLSKVESGKMEIQCVRCSPLALLAEVVSLMHVRADSRSLLLEAEAVGLLPETVLTDPLRLRQVLVNLVGNAIKFTDQGEVRVGVRLVGDGVLQRLRFDVTDTGIGMNEEQMAKLFQPFSQVDNSPARKYGGTGLGLAISQRLVEALGGTIEVCSAPGKGSTFSLTIDPGPLDGIPLVQQTEANVLPPSATATPATSATIELHARVLLAEDGPDNLRLISLLLRKAGADVVAVDNGQLAVEAALGQIEAGCPFDVILMDMQMPVMDGYTATRSLRHHGYAGPIVALTAHAMAEDRQACLDAGCDDYTTKPIDRQRLLATVALWAAQAASNRNGDCIDRAGAAKTVLARHQASPQDPSA